MDSPDEQPTTSPNAHTRSRRRLSELIGPEPAELIVDLLPQFDWSDCVTRDDLTHLATKSDLELVRSEIVNLGTSVDLKISELRGETRTDFAELRGELALHRSSSASVFKSVRNDMTAEFTAVRNDMTAGFQSVRHDMATELTAVRNDMTTGFQAVRGNAASLDATLRADMTRLFDRFGWRMIRYLFIAQGLTLSVTFAMIQTMR